MKEEICKEVVYNFCTEFNEWEALYFSLKRAETRRIEGKVIADKLKKKIEGHSIDEQKARHAKIFEKYINPRDRKYGSNPGEPGSCGDPVTYRNVSKERIISTDFPRQNRCEIIANWGIWDDGKIMFVLLKKNNKWRIDSIKKYYESDGKWSVWHL